MYILRLLVSVSAITVCTLAANAGRDNSDRHSCRHLVALLSQAKEKCEVNPDSLHTYIRLLRKEVETLTDSASKAVYQATLAHLLMRNSWLAQTGKRETESPKDSTEEWSQEELCTYAASLYRSSLAQMEALFCLPSKAWLPLTNRGKDEKVFGGGMLPIVWKAMEQDFTQHERRQYSLPAYAAMISMYERHGLEEAAMLTALDSINAVEWDKRETEYRTLIDKYGHLEASDIVYTRLAAVLDKEKQVALLREALERHKDSKAIRNALNSALQPVLTYRLPRICCPGKEYNIQFSVANMENMTVTVYKMDNGFKPTDGKPLHAQVKRAGKVVQRLHHTLGQHPAEQLLCDTLPWKAPEPGTYAMTVDGKAGLKTDKGSAPETHLFYVSRLGRIVHTLPDGKTRVMVVDAMSGKPQPGVNVKVERRRDNGEYTLLKDGVTDNRGIVQYHSDKSNRVRIGIFKDDDCAWLDAADDTSIYLPYNRPQQGEETNETRIFTDRSIYRPGQTVHIAALAYSRRGDEAKVREGQVLKLSMTDTKRHKIHKSSPKTDDFGMASDSLTLPADARPGTYLICVDGQTTSIRVEEYRRPTFMVKTDEVPAASFPMDTLSLTGKAQTYNGMPVAGARVTGKATFSGSLWKCRTAAASVKLDTLTTDTEGRFTVKVPLEEGMRFIKTTGTRVTVRLDVLARTGETQQGEAYVSLCSRPFVLTGEIPSLQDRNAPRPWSFTLLSGTGTPIDGEVTCRIMTDGKEAAMFPVQAGTGVVPKGLAALPSGDYEVKAEYTNGTDTARWESSFSLISIDDRHLYGKQVLRIYAPTDTFSTERPAAFLIGTTLKDSWVYCTVTSGKTTVSDTLMCLSDTAFVWTIPYREEYGDGVAVSACLMHNGEMHYASQAFYKAKPDDKLKMEWETFRDISSPGKCELWTMRLYMPDGTPARANVVLSMYDASLDALRKHEISLRLFYPRFVPFARYMENGAFHPSRWLWCLNLQPKMYNWREKTFSVFNPYYFYFDTQAYETSARPLRRGQQLLVRGTKGAYARNELQLANTDMLMGKVAGLPADAVSEEAPAGEDGLSDVAVRGSKDIAFSSLAFFMPTIRTDGNGSASVSFSMPESLTGWHLTGFAHTKDMMSAGIDETIVARKELTATLYLPRFVRQGDSFSFTASIRNTSDKAQKGTAICTLADAATNKVLMRKDMHFSLETGADTVYTLLYKVPAETKSVVAVWKAKGSDFSDGEQRTIPVLSDKEEVTETKVFALRKPGTTHITLSSLFGNDSPSATDRSITVEYAAHPVWFALKSLPHLFTPSHNDALSLCAAYYATTLAQHITSKADNTEWLADSLHYGTQLSLDRRMSLLTALASLQQTDGSFAWYPGMRGNTFVTTEVAMLLARLHHAAAASDAASTAADRMLDKAIGFMGTRKEGYAPALPYLYILHRSGMAKNGKDIKNKVEAIAKEADSYASAEHKAMAAIVLKAYGKEKEAAKLMAGIERRIRQADGFYIAYPSGSQTSIDRKIMAHVQVMEAFRETMPEKEDVAEGLTEWLLLQKRTQQWNNPVNTANAVYALLQADWTQTKDMTCDVLKLKDVNGTHKMSSTSDVTGYLRDSMRVKAPQTLSVEKRTPSLSWGSVYATYTMPIDSIDAHWQGFKIRRDIPGQRYKVGDRIHIRYTVTADHDYNFVCLQMPRPAAAEPAEQMSGYYWQGGLGYYAVTGDNGSEYFVDNMPKGTYVIEEDWIVSHNGNFSLGSAIIKCLYAEEYQSHTSSAQLKIGESEKVKKSINNN